MDYCDSFEIMDKTHCGSLEDMDTTYCESIEYAERITETGFKTQNLTQDEILNRRRHWRDLWE